MICFWPSVSNRTLLASIASKAWAPVACRACFHRYAAFPPGSNFYSYASFITESQTSAESVFYEAEVVKKQRGRRSPDQVLGVAWLLFSPSQQVFETFNRKNKIGNNFNQGLSTVINSLHRWLALTKLPPCQPPGERIPYVLRKKQIPSWYLLVESLFSNSISQRTWGHLCLLSVYF